MAKLLGSITEKGMSIRQLSCKTGINCKTVRKFIDLIVQVQGSPRLKLEMVGLRVLVTREKPATPKARICDNLPNQEQMR